MLTYLIILLDNTSVSYCHYDNAKGKKKLISLNDLKAGIVFAMKENLNIQFVYPNYKLPEEYREVIDSVDHTNIGPIGCKENLDLIVIDGLNIIADNTKSYLWRCSLMELCQAKDDIAMILPNVSRLNVVLTDIPTWKEKEFAAYESLLNALVEKVVELYKNGVSVQLNLLTDRFMLGKMNNCNAGDTNITLAPDGRYYICPAFYPTISIGGVKEGLSIPNKQLYRIDHAPICRKCDAYQCRRCIWMNEMMTLDWNTPSHEQCVVSHLERNASRKLLSILEAYGIELVDCYGIEEIDYLDPFNILNKWN